MATAPWVVSDELWERVEPLLPKVERRFRYPGRKRVPDREALCGILFVLYTGIAWRHLPLELGFGSGATCYRRLDEWQRAGVWERLHEHAARRVTRCWGDRVGRGRSRTEPCAGEKGGSETGPSPVDRARNGSKHHLLVDGSGLPLAWSVTGGNRNDVTQLIPLVDKVPPVRGKVGRPRRRPDRVTRRPRLRPRQVPPPATPARHQTRDRPPQHRHGSGLGRYRWVVERTFAWLHQFKRLLVRYDRRAEIHEAFLAIGCCLVCFRRLQKSF